MCRLINGAWEGRKRKGPRLDRPKNPRHVAAPYGAAIKKIFLPRYLGKNIFSPLQNRYPQKRLKP